MNAATRDPASKSGEKGCPTKGVCSTSLRAKSLSDYGPKDIMRGCPPSWQSFGGAELYIWVSGIQLTLL